jgi:hypothetical protein
VKLKILIYTALAFLLFVALWGFFTLRNSNEATTIDENRTVYIKNTENGFQLFRNGKPFYIQGAGGESYFMELAEIGGNTIRLYDTLNLQNKLDEAHKYNLAVIVDIPIPAYNKLYNLYEDEKENLILKQKIKNFIHQYKEHPALLIWNLGNEIKYPFVLKKNKFIKTFNELVSIIQTEDPNHPVSTAIAGVSRKAMSSIYIHSPEIDLLSFNTFGGTKLTNSNFAQISFLFGSRPYFFSELGSDGPWEARFTAWGAQIEQTTVKKAEHYKERYNFVQNNKDKGCLGSLFFYWGTKLERTHTWFSLFKDGSKSEIIKEIEHIWNNNVKKPSFFGMDYMLVNEKGAYDNIVFVPDELINSKLIFNHKGFDSLLIEWEIRPEAWHLDTGYVELSFDNKVRSFVSIDKNTATFITPGIEGAYRIFAYVYDKDGYFATTNTPFYVLKNK